MPEVPNFKQYVRRVAKENNPGEGSPLTGGIVVDVDLLNLGIKQTLNFHKDGVSFEDAFAKDGEEFTARVSELNAMLPPEEQGDPLAQRLSYNQAINEVFGSVVFGLEVLVKRQSAAIYDLEQRVFTLEEAVNGPAA